jgi:hypothetical protein
MRTAELFEFIRERHRIYHKKRNGEPKPWTTWPELQKWRFCNVYRELDAVTEWISQNWREPHRNDPDLWFAMCVARWINWPDTLAEIGYPLPWHPDRVLAVLRDRAARGKVVWGPAYTIGTDARRGEKAVCIVDRVLDRAWQNREQLRPRDGDSLAGYAERLGAQYRFGGFMTGQVIADLKYVEPLKSAKDWWTWAISGPGSRRGLNRVLNRRKDAHWTEWEWRFEFRKLHAEIEPMIRKVKLPRLHAQDLQNCLCEFDKLQREQLGEGHPRRRYPGTA